MKQASFTFGSETDGSHTDVSKINTTGSTPGITPHDARGKSSSATSGKASQQSSSETGS